MRNKITELNQTIGKLSYIVRLVKDGNLFAGTLVEDLDDVHKKFSQLGIELAVGLGKLEHDLEHTKMLYEMSNKRR